MKTLEITQQQAKLFLELLSTLESLPKEDNILKETFGKIEVSLIDTFLLKKKLEEFIEANELKECEVK